MKKFHTLVFSLFLILFITKTTFSLNVNCSANLDPLTGCTACPNPASQSLAINIQTQKYICTAILNCQTVLNNQTCISCRSLYFLTLDSSSNQICQPINSTITNCLAYDTSTKKCLKCYPNYILASNSTQCLNNTNIYCLAYNNSTLTCVQCIFSFMNSSNNCMVESNICSYFDYSKMKCIQCPVNMYMNSQGTFCVDRLKNCIIQGDNGCVQCEEQYEKVFDNSTNKTSCQFQETIQLEYLTDPQKSLCVMKKYQYKFDNASSKYICRPPTSNITYCSTDNSNGTCLKCIPGFYLSTNLSSSNPNNQCLYCGRYISNCRTCTSSTICTLCQLQYFVYNQASTINGISSVVSECRKCSIYGCKRCQSIQNRVMCLDCYRSYQLFNYTCYQCDAGKSLNVTTLKCDSCLNIDANCQYCDLATKSCTWCIEGYARVLVGGSFVCKDVNNITVSELKSPETIKEILIKAFPKQQTLIFKDAVELISSCQQSALIYTCLCRQSTKVTNLCYSIQSNLASITDLSLVFGTNNITGQIFLQNVQTLRLMAQLPGFDNLNFNIQSSTLIPQNKIASLLEIYSQMLRRQSGVSSVVLSKFDKQQASIDYEQNKIKNRLLLTSSQILNQLFSLIQTSFTSSFLSTQPSIFYGNGYYLKYYPVGVADSTSTDTSFISLADRKLTQFACVFVWFQNFISSKSLSGNVYVFTPSSTAYSQNLTIKQLRQPQSNAGYTYKIFHNNNLLNSTISKSSQSQQTYLTFTLMTSTSTGQNQYSIQYQLNQATNFQQLFSNQRIQFIFYQPAFIYVLVFLVLYLFLIPCCSLVNLIQQKTSHRRKRVRSVDYSNSQQGKAQLERQGQQRSQETQVIEINYKDFFPIYNICNTPRPRRILKLCLFLLNTQHGITFLTLFYFNLQANHPVVAVILGLPGYFCTIIMAYICGILTLILPGFSKYLINLITIGYWILWIFLMPRFLSQDYQPYVYIFTIVYFLIDLIIDALETFMVYFTIKQSQRQVKMFGCLAAWLSKRGFYEYDKLAKQLNESEG